MGLANCKECGKLFMQNPAGLCPECFRIEEANEERVAKYLRSNPHASITQVNEATGVPEKVILKMIKKGRITGDIRIEYPCESCGKPIAEGRVCPECGRRVLEQLKGEIKPAHKTSEPPSAKPGGGGVHSRIDRY